MTPKQWAKRAYRAGNRYVAIRLAQRQAVRPAEFDEVKGQVMSDVRQAKLDEKFRRAVTGMRTVLRGGGSFDSVAALYGGLKDTGPFTQTQSFVPNLGFESRRDRSEASSSRPARVSDTLRAARTRACTGCVWRSGSTPTTRTSRPWSRRSVRSW